MRKAVTNLLALAVIATAQEAITAPVEPRHEGTPVPVTVYEYDGYDAYSYQNWKYNYHTNRYYISNSGTVDGNFTQDQTDGYSVYDPWTGSYDGYVSSRWEW